MLVHLRVDCCTPQGHFISREQLFQMLYALLAGYDTSYLQLGRHPLGDEGLPGQFHTFSRGKHRVYNQ
jgi:hypothetical protein